MDFNPLLNVKELHFGLTGALMKPVFRMQFTRESIKDACRDDKSIRRQAVLGQQIRHEALFCLDAPKSQVDVGRNDLRRRLARGLAILVRWKGRTRSD